MKVSTTYLRNLEVKELNVEDLPTLQILIALLKPLNQTNEKDILNRCYSSFSIN
jgi:hypothetical protein